jgi:PAS domain S-box-containing protein
MDKEIINNGISILVVEDERIVASDIKRRLMGLGYSIAAVCSKGEEAVETALSLVPDIILMDIHLKGEMDGVSAAQIIQRKKDIPVIYLTASTDDSTIERAKTTEPYGYLVKPFEVKDLRTCLEITVYKAEVKKQKKENEQWLNTTINSLDEGVISTDKDGNIKFINNVAAEMLNVSPAECVGRPLGGIYRTEYELPNEVLLLEMNRKSSGTGTEINRLKILYTDLNKSILIEETTNNITGADGNIIGKVLCFRDVSERIKLAVKTLTAKNYYLSLLEDFPALMWRADVNGKFNFFNRTWLNFRGKNIEDEIDRKWTEGIHPEDKAAFINKFDEAFKEKNDLRIELRLRNRYNEFRWMYCIAAPFYDNEQSFDGYIGSCIDITDRKKMEVELKEAKVNAENSAKAKGEFIANISHEIKTPLNHIIGFSDLLLGPNLTKEQQEYINIIKKSGYSLAEMLNSILNLTLLETGKTPVKEVHFSMERMLGELVNSFAEQAAEKNIEIEYFVGKNVSEIIIGDKEKVKDILSRLLDNALKFTFKGKASIGVFQENSNDGLCELHFVVSDTGIGISPAELNIIFDPFTQADGSSTRKFSGAGLGLTIVKRTIDLLDGKLWAESSYGKGSKFHFVLKFKTSVKTIKNIYR